VRADSVAAPSRSAVDPQDSVQLRVHCIAVEITPHADGCRNLTRVGQARLQLTLPHHACHNHSH
jgi:hypothetical protein